MLEICLWFSVKNKLVVDCSRKASFYYFNPQNIYIHFFIKFWYLTQSTVTVLSYIMCRLFKKKLFFSLAFIKSHFYFEASGFNKAVSTTMLLTKPLITQWKLSSWLWNSSNSFSSTLLLSYFDYLSIILR